MRRSIPATREQPAARRALRARTPAEAVLQLQRMAGNGATTWLLRKGRTTAEFDFSKPKTKGTKTGGWFRKRPRQVEEEKKQKPSDRPKFKTEWLIKEGGGYGGMHEQKSVEGFKSWADVRASNEGLEFKGTVPGLARTLFVGLFLGEADWNSDNWGFGPGAGGWEVRRVDVTGFDFDAEIQDLLTPEALLKAAKWVPLRPEFMDKSELATVIRDVSERGEEVIKRLGAAFRPEFEELGAVHVYEGYLAQLLERHKTLRSVAAKS